jgi:hypothetical protein
MSQFSSRRLFFRRIGAIIAAVAIAPEIAFARTLETRLTVSTDQSILFWEEVPVRWVISKDWGKTLKNRRNAPPAPELIA